MIKARSNSRAAGRPGRLVRATPPRTAAVEANRFFSSVKPPPRAEADLIAEAEGFIASFDVNLHGACSVYENMKKTFVNSPSKCGKQYDLGLKKGHSNLLAEKRLDWIEEVTIVAPSTDKVPLWQSVEDLKTRPHALVVDMVELRNYVKELAKRNIPVRFVYPNSADPKPNECRDYVNVWRKSPFVDNTGTIYDESLLTKLAQEIIKHGDFDSGRGHYCISLGTTGGQAWERNEFGLMKPSPCARKPGVDYTIFEEFVGLFFDVAPQRIPAEEVHRRETEPEYKQRRFWFDPYTHKKSWVDTFLFQLRECAKGCGLHTDPKNCNNKGNGWVTIFTCIIEIDGVLYRLSILGYSRASITTHMKEQYSIVDLIVEPLATWYESLPDWRKDLSTGDTYIHPQPDRYATTNSKPIVRDVPTVKLPFYAHQAEMCMDGYQYYEKINDDNLPLDGLILAASVTTNQCMFHDTLLNVIKKMMSTGVKEKKVGHKLFQDFHKEYLRLQSLGLYPDSRTLSSLNQLKEDSRYEHSCQLFAELSRWAFAAISDRRDPLEVYLEVVRRAIDPKHGLLGIGEFLVQHFIAIACLCGRLPRELLFCAHIASTTATWKTLVKMSPLLKEGDQKVVAQKLLKAICLRLNIQPPVAEQLVCEWIRSTKKRAPPKEFVFAGQNIPFYEGEKIMCRHPVDPNNPFEYVFPVHSVTYKRTYLTSINPHSALHCAVSSLEYEAHLSRLSEALPETLRRPGRPAETVVEPAAKRPKIDSYEGQLGTTDHTGRDGGPIEFIHGDVSVVGVKLHNVWDGPNAPVNPIPDSCGSALVSPREVRLKQVFLPSFDYFPSKTVCVPRLAATCLFGVAGASVLNINVHVGLLQQLPINLQMKNFGQEGNTGRMKGDYHAAVITDGAAQMKGGYQPPAVGPAVDLFNVRHSGVGKVKGEKSDGKIHRFYARSSYAVDFLLWSAVLNPASSGVLFDYILPEILETKDLSTVTPPLNGRVLHRKGRHTPIAIVYNVTPVSFDIVAFSEKGKKTGRVVTIRDNRARRGVVSV